MYGTHLLGAEGFRQVYDAFKNGTPLSQTRKDRMAENKYPTDPKKFMAALMKKFVANREKALSKRKTS